MLIDKRRAASQEAVGHALSMDDGDDTSTVTKKRTSMGSEDIAMNTKHGSIALCSPGRPPWAKNLILEQISY